MLRLLLLQVMKTYHMYHTESLSAESKLKEAEKQEEKHIGKANDIGSALLRYGHDERPQRRSSVKKMEKLKEKVSWHPLPSGSEQNGVKIKVLASDCFSGSRILVDCL